MRGLVVKGGALLAVWLSGCSLVVGDLDLPDASALPTPAASDGGVDGGDGGTPPADQAEASDLSAEGR